MLARRPGLDRPRVCLDRDLAAVRLWTPARILTSVLFPAPFSPTSAWTSDGRSSIDTSDRACVAPKRLETWRSATAGILSEESAFAGCVTGSFTARMVREAGRDPPWLRVARAAGSTSWICDAPPSQILGHAGRSGGVADDRRDPARRTEGRECGALPLGVVDDRHDLRRGRNHQPFDLGLFLGGIARDPRRSRSRRPPRRPSGRRPSRKRRSLTGRRGSSPPSAGSPRACAAVTAMTRPLSRAPARWSSPSGVPASR